MDVCERIGRLGLVLFVAAVPLLGACAKKPEPTPGLSAYSPPIVSQQVPQEVKIAEAAATKVAQEAATEIPVSDPTLTGSIRPGMDLKGGAGRVLAISSQSDLSLRPGEVILTFDDGPSPSVTPLILSALDKAGVKAVFFMVGQRASAHPELVVKVAEAGHSIGTHTRTHADLTRLSEAGALAQIRTGSRALKRILKPKGFSPAPFFRFPYLAQSALLRADVRHNGYVIFGADVDSKDYWKDSPDAVLARTLRRLDQAGRGIILFHDIHKRTAAMLPDFLKALKNRGYRVVDAVPPSGLEQMMPAEIASRSPLAPLQASPRRHAAASVLPEGP